MSGPTRGFKPAPFISDLLRLPLQSSKNDFRRKWDKDEYEDLAQKRLAEERDKDRERRDGEKKLTNKSCGDVDSVSDDYKVPQCQMFLPFLVTSLLFISD